MCDLKELIDEYLELREVGMPGYPMHEVMVRCNGQDLLSLGTGASLKARHALMFALFENIAKRAISKHTAALKKQVAELEYQQEADTSTVGILADVVDVLWEDDTRCEKHGYGDVVGKAKEVVGRSAQLRNALEVATVTMASVWPEDFIEFFSDDEIRAMLDRTKPEKDFRVEELMYKVLSRKGE